MKYRVETKDIAGSEWCCESRHCFTYADLTLATELAQALAKNPTCYSKVRVWDIDLGQPVIVYTAIAVPVREGREQKGGVNPTNTSWARPGPPGARYGTCTLAGPVRATMVHAEDVGRRKYPRGLKGILLRLADKL